MPLPRATEGRAKVKPATVRPGQTITASGGGYAPHSPVQALLLPQGVPLGAATADASGCVAVRLSVALGVEPGTHELHLVGENEAGGTHRNVAALTIRGPTRPPAPLGDLLGLVTELAAGVFDALQGRSTCASG